MRTNTDYIKFIREQPCIVTGMRAVPHHVRTIGDSGIGCKPPDYYSIPIDPVMHIEVLHRHGEQSFYDKQFINPEREIIKLLIRYIERQNEQT